MWCQEKGIYVFVLSLIVLWFTLHVPAIMYGTSDVPLHASYLTADEQSSINGALHVLQSRSILGLQNQTTLYYGPVMAMLAVPAVLADFAVRLATGVVHNALNYKDFIVWNWGGALAWARVIAVFAGLSSIIAVYQLFLTRTLNPSGNRNIAWLAASLLATNYLFFEYSGAFRHWLFVITFLLWQFVVFVWLLEAEGNKKWLWIAEVFLTVSIFGISYVGLIYQIFWIPVLLHWWRMGATKRLKEFCYYLLGVFSGVTLVILWHPYGFLRTFGMFKVSPNSTVSTAPVVEISHTQAIIDSLLYYANVIFINNITLCIAGVLLLFVIVRKKVQAPYWASIFLLPTIAHYIFFSFHAHNESRYMLPAVVLGLVAIVVAYAKAYASLGQQHLLVRISRSLFIISICLGIIQIAGFVRMMQYGPAERALILPQVEEWQKEKPDAKILFVKNWPLGYVHTHAAYSDYITRYNKESYDLWKYILTLQSPKGIVPINVYYKHADDLVTEKDMQTFDHIVVYNLPKVDAAIAPESPQDIFDVKPWTILNFKNYQETYTILK